jgi:rubredoxin
METVTVRTFDNAILAHITSDKLTNAGIENYIFDENTNTVMPMWGMAIGGIKIAVDKVDEQKALQALYEMDEEYRKSAVCPKCNATEIILIPKKSAGSMMLGIFTWLFSNKAVPGELVYHCKNCGYESETLPEPPEDYVNPDML